MRWLLLTVLVLFFPLAVSAEVLTVGERSVQYDTSNEIEQTTLYYLADTLVASETDGITIVYENNEAILEAHDTDNDGLPDTFISLDANDAIKEVSGTASEKLLGPEVTEFEELLALEEGGVSASEDLVGSLDSISIPKHRSYGLYFFLLILVGGIWWYLKKRK